MKGCVFCAIVAGDVPADVLFEDERHLAFFPLEHINPGHVLLIPKGHVDYLFDLPERDYAALWSLAARLAPGLRTVTSVKRVAVAVEGFSVPHVHLHLVPVNAGDELDPSRAAPLSAGESQRLATALRRAWVGSPSQQRELTMASGRDDDTVTGAILALERQLMLPEVRRDASRAGAMLDDGFVEFGSSGTIYGKSEVLAALAEDRACPPDIEAFSVRTIAPGVVLATYHAVRPGEAAVRSLRSSLWKLSDGRWKLVFHQGTATASSMPPRTGGTP